MEQYLNGSESKIPNFWKPMVLCIMGLAKVQKDCQGHQWQNVQKQLNQTWRKMTSQIQARIDVSFIEELSFALEPPQDQVWPCLPTEHLERRNKLEQ